MKIGFVGLGKLGFPVALAAARKHDVVGTDVTPDAERWLRTQHFPHREEGIEPYLKDGRLRFVPSVTEVVAHADLVFVAIQTPHHPQYEGVTRVPTTRANFDYSFLAQGVKAIAAAARTLNKDIIIAIISTVLPGTTERDLMPLLNARTRVVYNPFFIAMGTTIQDYLQPEFVLLGVEDANAALVVRDFYMTMTSAPVIPMSIKSAELTKVAYNCMISQKIVLANTIMQICHETGANTDEVTNALGRANVRLMSSKYLCGGMGDGGGCHPRDLIAMSWLAEQLGMRYDYFGTLMKVREEQTMWLARLVLAEMVRTNLPVVLLGKSFKAETNLTIGSPATLLKHLLLELGVTVQDHYDPYLDPPRTFTVPAVFVVATAHQELLTMPLPAGSVVVDPWGRSPPRPGVHTMLVGRLA